MAIEIKKYKTLVYRYYDYLREHHYGKENGINREELAKHFGISLNNQKSILREINCSRVFPKLVSTSKCIYMCKTKDECEEAIYNERKSALTRLQKSAIMEEKMRANNQGKILMSNRCKPFVECYVAEGDDK